MLNTNIQSYPETLYIDPVGEIEEYASRWRCEWFSG